MQHFNEKKIAIEPHHSPQEQYIPIWIYKQLYYSKIKIVFADAKDGLKLKTQQMIAESDILIFLYLFSWQQSY